ncbi:MAG: ATP-binding protein [Anaerolineaceae bacterium]|nr:ATP-binding protein [Anaerolineaceae bacterium]
MSDPQVSFLLERVLASGGYSVIKTQDWPSTQKELQSKSPAMIILSDKLGESNGLDVAAELAQRWPAIPLLLFVEEDTPELLKKALSVGVSDYLCLPLRAEDITNAVQRSLEKARQRREWVLLETRRNTASLQRKVDELEALARLGRSITGSLDLDSVLSAIVDAAVELTGAEEGSLLLLDESTGELYMRAARNFQDEFVRTFRLPVQDTLAGSVLRTGKPALLDEATPQKIKTAYLVHSLVYVPLQLHDRVFGVLGVDNRHERLPFKDRDVKLLSAFAEYAVIAIENARLYANTILERNKLETVLTQIQDGVIVLDLDQRILLVNHTAQLAFSLSDQPLAGKKLNEVFSQSEILELVDSAGKSLSNRQEITVDDGRIFSILVTPIPAIGLAITMHDITNLKKLDRIKSDFVSTVSHDLRSPLTAIMGYVELIERAGTVNDMQRDFIRRVHVNVTNITSLMDDLLNLSHIESGFDGSKDKIYLDQLVSYSADNFSKQFSDKNLKLVYEIPDAVPPLYANAIQLRQMLDNLLANAVKYTPSNGTVTIHMEVEQNQIIIQVRDSGIGIPPMDLPYIFDKFYRAGNVGNEVTGTGLGLAIVKSIVENHNGRIWVDSIVGQGSTFTVVLPLGQP